MVFRRKRRALVRAGALALSLASYLLSIGPATAGVIYCISDSGHSGFEVVAAGQSGCASCCHDPLEGSEHDGLGAERDECTDVAWALPQNAGRNGSVVAGPTLLPLPLLLAAGPSPDRATAAGPRSQTALAPPRSSPSMLIVSTVLTI